jgi:hypothetical protein
MLKMSGSSPKRSFHPVSYTFREKKCRIDGIRSQKMPHHIRPAESMHRRLQTLGNLEEEAESYQLRVSTLSSKIGQGEVQPTRQ